MRPDEPSTRADDFGAAGEISISTPLGLAVFNLVLCQGHPSIHLTIQHDALDRTVLSDGPLWPVRSQDEIVGHLLESSPGPCHLSGDPPLCRQGSNMPPATSPGRYIRIYFVLIPGPHRLWTSRQLGAPPVVRTVRTNNTFGTDHQSLDGMLPSPFAGPPWKQSVGERLSANASA
ncbi:hypothetical protein JB92DRAFT_3118180 [Gautieria morchelliformis]|nr:hypothetical protein JB92DRAFT_3118180 [Gautieria morchelliformis]